jgi:hypothetical protein
MANFNIEHLTTLLNKPNASKEEILARIEQIQFTSIPSTLTINGSTKDILKDNLEMCHTIKFNPQTRYPNIGRNQQKLFEYSNTQQSSTSKVKEKGSRLNNSVRSNPSSKNKLIQKQTKCESVDNKLQPLSISKLNRNSQRVSDFLGRVEEYQYQTRIRLETQQDQQKETELNECSFYPKTNTGSPRRSSFYEDLKRYEIWRKRSMEQHLLEKEHREKEKLKECTFHPVINSEKLQEQYATDILKRLHAWDKGYNNEFTFHPEVKLPPKLKQKLQEYLNSNSYERLSKLATSKNESRTVMECKKFKRKSDSNSSLITKNSIESGKEPLKKLRSNAESVIGCKLGSSHQLNVRVSHTVISPFITRREGTRSIICYSKPQEKLITKELEDHLRSGEKRNREIRLKLGKELNKLKSGIVKTVDESNN